MSASLGDDARRALAAEPKLCTHCKVKPRRSPKQRWCHECHADYVRFRRQSEAERESFVEYQPRTEYGIFSGVYFLWCHGFVKAGQSCDVVARYRQIQCANPRTIYPLGYISERNIVGLDALEFEVLCALDKDRYRGEWFVCTREVLDFIAARSAPWPVEAGEGFSVASDRR